jgi:uncharacterized SAM-binding protein YcdF (DUF218 family)
MRSLPSRERAVFHYLRLTLSLIGLLVIAVNTPLAYFYSLPLRAASEPQKSDVIVLMSHGQLSRNWLSLVGTQRTMGALRLYRQSYAPYIISSGSTHSGYLDQAGLQAKWLMMANVPSEAILVERRSTRTYESVAEVLQIMKGKGWQSAVIVASEMDVPRIRAVFSKLGFFNISFEQVPETRKPSKSTLYYEAGPSVFWHATYEYAGFVLYKLKGWI